VAALYLGLAGLHQAYREAKMRSGEPPTDQDRRIQQALDELAQMLAFPPARNSPANFRREPEFDIQLDRILAVLSHRLD
jgi:hypothetical protein